jgi:uncharacterized protein (TIGR02001 family)
MVRVGGRILAGVSAALIGGAAMTVLSVSANAADLSYKDAPAEVHGAGRTLSVTGFAALTSDYIFRGISQSDNDPALQAQVDITYGILYAGVFASSVDLANLAATADGTLEVDIYAGVKPTWNGVTFDFGVIYYAYPGSEEFSGVDDIDYLEFKAGISGTLFNKLGAYANLFYTDDGFGNADEVWTVEGGLSKTLFTHRSVAFSASGALGYVDASDPTIPDDAEDYAYWNVGITATVKEKYSLDVRYHDTDIGDDNASEPLATERVVVTGKISF